jgi:hypothetical protein
LLPVVIGIGRKDDWAMCEVALVQECKQDSLLVAAVRFLLHFIEIIQAQQRGFHGLPEKALVKVGVVEGLEQLITTSEEAANTLGAGSIEDSAGQVSFSDTVRADE